MCAGLKVGIVTSHVDEFAAMAPAVELLDELNVPYEIVAIDLLETPLRAVEYAERAHSKGLRFILAGTGNSPDLGLTLARHTSLPVIGIPLRAAPLGQELPFLPVTTSEEIPVGTVAAGDARSAAIIAVRTLALSDEALNAKLSKLQS